MQFVSRLCAAALSIGLLVPVSSVNAWESDVHYGLTKWLAIHAGFTAQQASWMPTATKDRQELDHRSDIHHDCCLCAA